MSEVSPRQRVASSNVPSAFWCRSFASALAQQEEIGLAVVVVVPRDCARAAHAPRQETRGPAPSRFAAVRRRCGRTATRPSRSRRGRDRRRCPRRRASRRPALQACPAWRGPFVSPGACRRVGQERRRLVGIGHRGGSRIHELGLGAGGRERFAVPALRQVASASTSRRRCCRGATRTAASPPGPLPRGRRASAPARRCRRRSRCTAPPSTRPETTGALPAYRRC